MTAVAAKIREGFTDSLRASQLNFLAGTTFPAAPGTCYLALFSNQPDSSGANATEVTGTRQAITWSSVAALSDNRPFITPSTDLTQTLVNTSPAIVQAFGIYSASSGGTLYYIGLMPYPLAVSALQSVTVSANTLIVRV
jgi:hypothetical protein